MSDSPEPGFTRSRPQSQRQWDMPVGGPVVPHEPPPHALSAVVRRRLRLSIMAAAVLFAGLVATFPPSRPTADTAPAAAPPAWNVELMAAGRRPVTALVYGAEAGLHLVRVPAAAAGGAELELTRFRGRLTRPNFGVEVVHEIQREGRTSNTTYPARV